MVNVTNDIHMTLDNRVVSIITRLDVRAAFDTVDHIIDKNTHPETCSLEQYFSYNGG